MPDDADSPPADLESIWQLARDELRSTMPDATFRLWLEPLRAVGMRGSTACLSAPAGSRAWVERRYGEGVLASLRKEHGGIERVELVAGGAPRQEAAPHAGDPKSLPVDPGHTFDRFVIGRSNRLAHASALAVAESPGEAYNPLFLHGPPGLGKTHLLGAIANFMRLRHPGLTVHLTTADRFTSEFVGALRADGPERFKRRYRGLDALLIDDVQALEGRAKTEEEFVHTFNALHGAGKQIVLSSDRPPDALAQLAERLRDRFSWGLTVELATPDLRTRTALLLRMAADAPGDLPDASALRELATRIPTNVRRLEGAMTRVRAYASLLGEPLSKAVIGQALSEDREVEGIRSPDPEATVATIQEAVSTTLGVPRAQLLSPRRTERVVRARQLAMYLARELTTLSLAQIAREFDRDHSTVLHAIRAVESRLEPGSETTTTIHRVRSQLGAIP